ncbi:MAG: NFACT RNA binding domain-containing protein [Candidatus Kapaibacterium sp.]
MINNYFILKAQSEYLNKELFNHSIEDSFIIEKNLVTIILKYKEYKYLKIVLEKNLETLFIDDPQSLPKKNVLNIFPSVESKSVHNVSIIEQNRVIIISLSDGYSIVFYAIPNKSNVFIVKEGIIIDSYKDKSDFIDKDIESLINKPPVSLQSEPEPIKEYIKRKYNYLGKYYKDELEKRFSEAEIANIDYNKIVEKLISEIDNSGRYYIYLNNDLLIPSLIDLAYCSDFKKNKHENINALIVSYYRKYKSLNEKKEVKNNLLAKVKADLKRSENKIGNLRKAIDEAGNSHIFKIFGDVLLANVYNIQSGLEFFEYIDENDSKHKIKLNPKLSAQENANQYYTKYKGLKNSVESLDKKLLLLISERESLMNKRDRLENEENFKTLRKMDNIESKKSEAEKLPFRIFKLSDKFEVWVGKDSASNDLLTMKYTNQYDYWFHVRGFSGSHTTLKLLDKNLKPEKEFILKAAEIAAYYSKARKGKHIPVAYTEKKYVKKRKGFKQGSVVMEKEKIVFVNPAVPEAGLN